MSPYIQTYSGECLALLAPDPAGILLQDVAHALSHICRFTGHSKTFYSVAQHSVLICEEAQDRCMNETTQRWALLHDATEAYLGDVSSPLKGLLPGYSRLEAIWQRAVADRFFLPRVMPDVIHTLDREALIAEAETFLIGGPQGDGWPSGGSSILLGPPMCPDEAEAAFLRHADRLGVM